MSYCLNPRCPNPGDQKTPDPLKAKFCSNCGTKLLLGDRYRALKSLGQGFYSRTLLAIDEHKPSQPRCIIKQTPIAGGSDEADESIDLFHQEAMRLEELGRHPQVPALLAHFVDHRHYFLIQSYIDGFSLESLVQAHGAFNEEQVRQVLNDCLPILQFVHAQQVIHRNITPENLIYTQPRPDVVHGASPNAATDEVQARLCLVDFESAKFARVSNIFMAGTQIGSQDYAAPEQLRGRATFSSDLYSLGATCLYLLTQKSPAYLYNFDQGSWQWRAHQKYPVSQDLAQVLDRLVSRLVRDRYSSANEALEVLNGGLAQLSDRPTFIPFINSPRPVIHESAAGEDSVLVTDEPVVPISSSTWNCRHTMTQHQAWIRAVALSQDGQLLASGSGDKTVKLWSTSTGELLHTFIGHSTWVRSVAISPDAKLVASGSNDKSIRLWDVYSGSPLREVNGHDDWVRSVVFSTDGKTLWSASQDKTIRLWNVESGKEVQCLTGHQHWVVALVLDPLGRYVASGSRDRTIRLWNLSTGKCFQRLKGHTGEIHGLAITPNGKQIVSSGADHTVRIWDAKTGEQVHMIEGQHHAINAIAISPDGSKMATGSNDKTIKLWDLASYKLLDTLTGHSGWVWTVAISKLSSTTSIIASGSWDGVIKVWQTRNP